MRRRFHPAALCRAACVPGLRGVASAASMLGPARFLVLVGVVCTLGLTSIAGASRAASAASAAPVRAAAAAEQKHPDVLDARVRISGPDRFDFDVTVSSPYDTPQRYADAFRVMDRDGKVYGERILWHDHAGEQPFTRDLYGVTIPPTVRVVVVQARDRRNGYGGRSIEVRLPGR